MEWVILFIVSWILFFLLVDWQELKINIFCGLLASFIQMSVDTNFISHGFYKIENPIVSIMGSSAFFTFGPAFVIGALISQFQSHKRFFQVANVLVLAALYTLQEVFLIINGALVYMNWSIVDSVLVNISAIINLSWFSMVVLNKKGYQVH